LAVAVVQLVHQVALTQVAEVSRFLLQMQIMVQVQAVAVVLTQVRTVDPAEMVS
jgi:hypothetical protein